LSWDCAISSCHLHGFLAGSASREEADQPQRYAIDRERVQAPRSKIPEKEPGAQVGRDSGGHGAGQNCHGKAGDDIVIPVPLGTLVYEDGKLLADLSQEGERFMIARGGRGGLGNQHFATAIKQAPRFAQRGEPGEEHHLDLQLKLLADAGIVGAPNAGKSTLLASVSAARPRSL